MKLVLIRHSKTILQKHVPNPLWQLSEEGIGLATEMSNQAEIKGIDVLYASNQTKAIQTALLLAKDNYIPLEIERNLTELTSITNKFIPDYGKSVSELYSGKVNRINQGETLEEGRSRFTEAVEKIVALNQGLEAIGIVAHGNILSIFSEMYEERTAYEIHQTIKMPDIAILDWDNKIFINTFSK